MGRVMTEIKMRALVVDDHPVNRLVFRSMLEMLGCAVGEAPEGRTALQMLSEAQYDLVLLDIHMPELSGFDVIEQLRTSGCCNGETRVVAVTADFSLPRSQYLAAGFDEYLNKPLSLEALVAQLGAVTDNWRASRGGGGGPVHGAAAGSAR